MNKQSHGAKKQMTFFQALVVFCCTHFNPLKFHFLKIEHAMQICGIMQIFFFLLFLKFASKQKGNKTGAIFYFNKNNNNVCSIKDSVHWSYYYITHIRALVRVQLNTRRKFSKRKNLLHENILQCHCKCERNFVRYFVFIVMCAAVAKY